MPEHNLGLSSRKVFYLDTFSQLLHLPPLLVEDDLDGIDKELEDGQAKEEVGGGEGGAAAHHDGEEHGLGEGAMQMDMEEK